MNIRRSSVGWLVAFGVLGCVAAGPVSAAQAYAEGSYLYCFDNEQNAESVAKNMQLGPANGATVMAGTPVTFSGESSYALTFGVASSETLLSSPDIDGGAGSRSGAFYRFTSTKAIATPRTIYWTASFTFTPEDCASPSTFTTPVRTLVVTPSEAELAATKRQQEEAAAKKKLEEEAAAKKKREEEAAAVAATGGVSLASTTIAVRGGVSLVKLNCLGIASCHGKLWLMAKSSVKVKGRKTRTVTIGTVSFSIAGDETKTVKLKLDAAGRVLLSTDHGRLILTARLTTLQLVPGPSQTQADKVHLVQQKAHGRTQK